MEEDSCGGRLADPLPSASPMPSCTESVTKQASRNTGQTLRASHWDPHYFLSPPQPTRFTLPAAEAQPGEMSKIVEAENQNSRMWESMSESRTGCDKTDDEQLFAAWPARPGHCAGGVGTEVGLKEHNDDVEVLSCFQNGLTHIRLSSKSAVAPSVPSATDRDALITLHSRAHMGKDNTATILSQIQSHYWMPTLHRG
ncbi:unnamed protein product [Pleuronectes platessa]|uniref:Uncharacterized protein n=1 Tax=Pleuronectes platessa TaxID=8262 RepID=A0A9N7Z2M8_PLEPL|nr:unnamed protein product [Pleuronectes platessa]